MEWQFKREEGTFEEIPVGTYRVAVAKASKEKSQRGNDMLKVELAVSGQKSHLWYYIPYLEDRPEITNRMLTQFIDSFGIDENKLNDLRDYVGKMGACAVKHDDDGRAKVSYFIKKNRQDLLPSFVGDIPKPEASVTSDGFMNIPAGSESDGLPF